MAGLYISELFKHYLMDYNLSLAKIVYHWMI